MELYLIINIALTSPSYGKSSSDVCDFPSIYKGKLMKECMLNTTSNKWWCFISENNYDGYNRYIECPQTSTTYAGSDPGSSCYFPFRYKNKLHYACVRSIDHYNFNVYWWCSTTPDYSSDVKKKWTRCKDQSQLLPCHFPNLTKSTNSQTPQLERTGLNIECRPFAGKWVCNTEKREIRECPATATTYAGNSPGTPCHFPFLYRSREYRSCISLKRRDKDTNTKLTRMKPEFETYQWCATTPDYDKDQLWTKCNKLGVSNSLQHYNEGSWADKRVLVPVVVLSIVLVFVVGLAVLLYCFCENSNDTWSVHNDPRNQYPLPACNTIQPDTSHNNGMQEDNRNLNGTLKLLTNHTDTDYLPSAPPPPYQEVLMDSIPTDT